MENLMFFLVGANKDYALSALITLISAVVITIFLFAFFVYFEGGKFISFLKRNKKILIAFIIVVIFALILFFVKDEITQEEIKKTILFFLLILFFLPEKIIDFITFPFRVIILSPVILFFYLTFKKN